MHRLVDRVRPFAARWYGTFHVVVLAFVAGIAFAASPPKVDDSELAALGFKPLVAATTAQKDWVHTMKPGTMRPMQRNGKKFYVVADPAQDRVFVGGPPQYAAYMKAHPGSQANTQAAANKGAASRQQSGNAMKEADGRDVSDPFYGAQWYPSWYDLGW